MNKYNCKNCNKKFKDYLSNGRIYCSKKCKNDAQKGFSGETHSQWSRVEKQCLECNKEFIVKNYRKDIAKFCSKKCSEIDRDEGRSSYNKRIRKSKEYKLWRELVYERDDYTCQGCLERGGELNPHHIINFSDNEDGRFNIDNGLTFCRKCHYDFHSEYGFKNNNIAQINNFCAVANET